MHSVCQMTSAQEEGRGRKIKPWTSARHGEQRVDVGFTVSGQQDDFSIDHLLARKTDPGKQPPDRRMEPHDDGRHLLDESRDPVLSADMQQFMTGDSALGVLFETEKRFWKEN